MTEPAPAQGDNEVGGSKAGPTYPHPDGLNDPAVDQQPLVDETDDEDEDQ